MKTGIMPLGILAILPTIGLLTVSFFVMVVLRKLEEGPLKSFGRVIAVLLCVAAFIVFTLGLYIVATGNCPVVNKIGKYGVQRTEHKMMSECMQKKMAGGMKSMQHMK